MASPLSTGVSGLVAHQKLLEVVGNNLANLNTTAYKSRRVVFSDLIYETVRPATGPVTGVFGGTNPSQVGTGSKVSQVDVKFAQGNLDQTGRQLDFAIDGDGFFVANDGAQNLFTRSGAFTLDEFGTLVDGATGYRIQRVGTLGEPDGVNPGFQTAGDASIRIPFGTSIPGNATTTVGIMGNLAASSTPALAEVLTSSTPYLTGGAAGTAATLLNALDDNTTPYPVAAGDNIVISGSDANGTAVNTTLAVTSASTLGDLVTAISGAYSAATASLDASGNLLLTADATGPASLSLSLADSVGNTGGTNFSNHLQVVTTDGKSADTVQSTVEVFDVRGGSHKVNLTFTKQANNLWDLTTSIATAEGTLTDNSIQQIRFNDNGSFQTVTGSGAGDADITIQFAGIAALQTVQFSFGTASSFEGLTELATDSTLAAQQNGFAPGALASINISTNGAIEGVATNGRRFPIAQLALASFQNPQGLNARGENYYEESLNTGPVQIGTALSGDRGLVRGNHLESSNVDIALEFTQLIVAQRGFSANARTITVADEVLEELTNVIR